MGRTGHDGVCRRYRGPKPPDHRKHPDEYIALITDRRWCSACERHLSYKGQYCPCCDTRLQHGRKNPLVKARLLAARKIIAARDAPPPPNDTHIRWEGIRPVVTFAILPKG